MFFKKGTQFISFLIIIFGGSELAAAQTKVETLSAIANIYEGQGNDCYQTENRLIANFKFLDVKNKGLIIFSYTFQFHENRRGYVGKEIVKDGGFNPADIDRIGTYQQREVYGLRLSCRGGSECVYSFTGEKYFDATDVLFCDATKRDRVARAFRHLQQFYTPSKPSPF